MAMPTVRLPISIKLLLEDVHDFKVSILDNFVVSYRDSEESIAIFWANDVVAAVLTFEMDRNNVTT